MMIHESIAESGVMRLMRTNQLAPCLRKFDSYAYVRILYLPSIPFGWVGQWLTINDGSAIADNRIEVHRHVAGSCVLHDLCFVRAEILGCP